MSQGYFFGGLPQWNSRFHKAPELPFSELLSAERINAELQRLGVTVTVHTPD